MNNPDISQLMKDIKEAKQKLDECYEKLKQNQTTYSIEPVYTPTTTGSNIDLKKEFNNHE